MGDAAWCRTGTVGQEVFMPDAQPPADDDLLRAVEHAHQSALAVLDDPDRSSLGAVTWLSVHLAAVDRVVYRAAERAAPAGAARLPRQRHTDHQLVQALWRLDRRLTGDVHHGAVPVPELEREVRDLLASHAAGEHQVLQALSTALDHDRLRSLADDLQKAMLRCPTRPHPDVPHNRVTARVVSWVEGVVDRARDLMDSRSIPTPRPAPVLPPVTRWGTYGTAMPSWPEPDDR